jgi:hypothetical protein
MIKGRPDMAPSISSFHFVLFDSGGQGFLKYLISVGAQRTDWKFMRKRDRT